MVAMIWNSLLKIMKMKDYLIDFWYYIIWVTGPREIYTVGSHINMFDLKLIAVFIWKSSLVFFLKWFPRFILNESIGAKVYHHFTMHFGPETPKFRESPTYSSKSPTPIISKEETRE